MVFLARPDWSRKRGENSLLSKRGKRGQSPFISLFCVVIFLRTHLAEHFLFQIGDATLELDVLHAAQLSFYGIDLRMKRDDLLFGRHAGHVASDVFDVFLRRHVFDDMNEHLTNLFECRLFHHARIITGETGTVTGGKRGQSPFISLLCVVIFLLEKRGGETGTVTVYFTFPWCNISKETGTLLRRGYGRAQQSPFIAFFDALQAFFCRSGK